MNDDDPPEGDLMVGVGEGVEQTLLPLQAVEYLAANLPTRLKQRVLSKAISAMG